MASVARPPNETVNMQSRVTKDGRKISYRMDVLQQPERARACGQGAKSSSDRRPVDPPPIVKLQVFEGDEHRDITFTHNASFFLFATLEQARPIAQGRVAQTTQVNAPVLTGTPVAGISYLDRPDPAGYFIFPDLSVRHEGKYRLAFTLYEDIKEERDADPNSEGADDVGAFVHGRCEVRSTPFDVYSAKKFPGLSESTMLSRTVADQGCRVRIRRDVRMRRHDSKHDKDWDTYDDDATKEGARAPSPDEEEDQKPVINATARGPIEAKPSYSTGAPIEQAQPATHGRPLAQSVPYSQYPHGYPGSSVAEQAPQQPYTHVPFQHGHPAQYSQPQYMSQPPQSMPQYQQYQYAMQQPGQPPQYQYLPQQQMTQPMYDPQQQQQAQHQQMYGPSGQAPPQYQQPSYSSAPSSMESYDRQATQQQLNPAGMQSGPLGPGKHLPPLKVPDLSSTKTELSSPMNPISAGRQPGNLMPSEAARPPPTFVSFVNSGVGSKRSYGSAFNSSHVNEPLRSGARPDMDAPHDISSEGSDEDFENLDQIKFTYRRADGSMTTVMPRRLDMF